MHETEFITLVDRMREAQRICTVNHSPANVKACRELEKQVDDEIARIKAFTNPLAFQPSLFQQPL